MDGTNRRYQGLPKVGPFALVSLGFALWQLDRMVKRVCRSISLGRQPAAKALRFPDPRCVVLFALARAFGHGPKTAQHDDDDALLRRSERGFAAWLLGPGSRRRELRILCRLLPLQRRTSSTEALRNIAPRLAAKLGDALRLSSPVRLIKQSGDGVEVVSDQLTVDAQRVIVATPPLLASRIEYDPALPARQTQLLRRLLSGSALRGITIYDEPFWRRDGLSGMSVAPDLPVPVALDQSPRSEGPEFSAVICSDRRRSGPPPSIPPSDATSGCAHWQCDMGPKLYRRGRIWKQTGPRNHGRSVA